VIQWADQHASANVQAGAVATPLWELSLLAQHYHPGVATACVQLAAGSWHLPLSGSVAAFATSLSVSTGAFNPAPQLKELAHS
jgi:NADPH-dependent 7-cyano-7-deazaguanine reductase QueF-like protein